MAKAKETFGPIESADETRQAQHQVANDAPVDCNPNAIIARNQMLTVAEAGRLFISTNHRREMIADALLMPRGGFNPPPATE